MKIIDILNKIANGEEVPNKVSFLDKEYEYHKDHMDYFDSNWGSLFQRIIDEYYEWLDLEVEILEITIHNKEDLRTSKRKIEKLERVEDFKFARLIDKINEIIDYIQE